MLESGVGDLGRHQVELAEPGHPCEVGQSGVGNLGFPEAEGLEPGKRLEVLQSAAGDRGAVEPQVPQAPSAP